MLEVVRDPLFLAIVYLKHIITWVVGENGQKEAILRKQNPIYRSLVRLPTCGSLCESYRPIPILTGIY